MITEDYVSFETAKLLKEKGFREWCSHCYGLDVRHNGETISFDEECELKDEGMGDEIEYVDGGQFYNYWCNNKNEGELYAAPSLYVAMKWLREVHNLTVDIFHCANWLVSIKTIPDDCLKADYSNSDLKPADTYEKACETGIRYVLENLI